MNPKSSAQQQPAVDTSTVHHGGLRYANLTHPDSPWSGVQPVSHSQVEPSGSDAVFPQLPSRLREIMGPAVEHLPQDHNAFFLNVTAPQRGNKLPVLVFIHGGAWATGGGTVRWYSGHGLAGAGVVVVTVNYRLGPAGHLRRDKQSHVPLDDLLHALRWVHTTIGEYGGDPTNITVAGQSAGAWYAWALAQDPRAGELMHRVALWSLPTVQPWSFTYRCEFTDHVLGQQAEDSVGLAEYEQVMQRGGAQLRTTSVPAGTMPPMYLPAEARPEKGLVQCVKNAVDKLHVEDIYVRHTAHEMAPFLPARQEDEKVSETLAALELRHEHDTISDQWPSAMLFEDGSRYDQMVQRATWGSYGKLAATIVETARTAQLRVIPRRFGGRSAVEGLGSPHCFDLPFQFKNLSDWHDAPMLQALDQVTATQWAAELSDDFLEFMHGDSSMSPRELGT